jgi:hypothetical protein
MGEQTIGQTIGQTVEPSQKLRAMVDNAISFHGIDYDHPEAEEGSRMDPKFYEFVVRGLLLRNYPVERLMDADASAVSTAETVAVVCLYHEFKGGYAEALKRLFKNYRTVEELERDRGFS